MAEKSTFKSFSKTITDNVRQMSDEEIQGKIKTVKENHSELIQVNSYIVKQHLKQIDREGSIDVLRSALPSFLLLLISLVVDVSYVPFLGRVANNFASYLFPGAQMTNQSVEPVKFWWLPFASYILFILFAYLSNRSLKKQIATKGPAEDIIARIIESYSGLVDAIATALPLLGAAILLISIKEGPTIFLGFSVPFEVKSILILAIGKLFGSVFEVQGLQFQAITEEVNKFKTEYDFYNQSANQELLLEGMKEANRDLITTMATTGGVKQISKEDAEQILNIIKFSQGVNDQFVKSIVTLKTTIAELSNIKVFSPDLVKQISDSLNTLTNVASLISKTSEYSATLKNNMEAIHKIGSEINSIKLPDEKVLSELQKTSQMLVETVNSLKDTNALKSLENLVYLAGKR
ncbi:MAG: hypothetical protein HY959_07140 [Ignavibacteriae bacterium]|nr:hypothetical protein [Ignavibacteriota bacterium]